MRAIIFLTSTSACIHRYVIIIIIVVVVVVVVVVINLWCCPLPHPFIYCNWFSISSASRQKGLSTSHLYTQLDPFALKLTSYCFQ